MVFMVVEYCRIWRFEPLVCCRGHGLLQFHGADQRAAAADRNASDGGPGAASDLTRTAQSALPVQLSERACHSERLPARRTDAGDTAEHSSAQDTQGERTGRA